MQTDDLIATLAADAGRAPGQTPPQRLALLVPVAAVIALVGVLVWLKVRPDLAEAASGGFFWIKAGYTAALGLGGFLAAERLSRPAASPRRGLIVSSAVLGLFLLAGLVQMLAVDAASPMSLIQGLSWKRCSLNILLLGAPSTGLGLWLVRGLAPTRPALAGFATGAFAGGVAATVYGLHCPESTFVFVGLWYSLGIMACAVLGAVLGRFVLRW